MIKSGERYRSRSLTPTRNHLPLHSPNPLPLPHRPSDPTIPDLLHSLSSSLSRLTQSVTLYSRLNQNGMLQRCLTHNNSISLYCVNQHRLLCVNCVYSGNKHKSHKVIPTVEGYLQIQKDISNYSFRLAQKLDLLEVMHTTAKENSERAKLIQSVLTGKLDRQFDEIMRSLSSKYLELKMELNRYFEEMVDMNVMVMGQLKSVRDGVERALEKLEDRGKKTVEPKDPNIFKHLVLASIVDNLQISGQIQNIQAVLENVEIHAFKEINRLRTDIAKHKWNRIN